MLGPLVLSASRVERGWGVSELGRRGCNSGLHHRVAGVARDEGAENVLPQQAAIKHHPCRMWPLRPPDVW